MMKKRLNNIGLFLIVLVFWLPASGGASSSLPLDETKSIIRTALLLNADHLIIRIRGRYRIVDPATGQDLDEGKRLKKTILLARDNGIQFGEALLQTRTIRIIPSKDVTIKIHNEERRYRGQIDVILNEKNLFTVVNRINLEPYVRGVLYHEASHRWPMAALKAQAVAARTYAVYQIESNIDNLYDVRSDIYSQVYGGRNSERYRTNLAVSRTEREILMFKGNVLPAYYHATCAGHTENVTELWDHEEMQPLKGKQCNFCQHSPHYRWKRNFRLKDIQDKLNSNGYKLGLIKKIEVVSRNKSGRIKDLRITCRDGKKEVIPGKKFRQVVGPNRIKSNNYMINMQGYFADFYGKGWGHGVGMCQWGAREMSRQHYDYKSILMYYYPNTEIVKI